MGRTPLARADGVGRGGRRAPAGGNGCAPGQAAAPILPLFVAGFLAAVLVRTLVEVPEPVLASADLAQTALLAMALFGLARRCDCANWFRPDGAR